MRIDKYLKESRIIKRRTISNEVCDNNKVFVNDKCVKAHYDVKIGDIIKIQFGEREILHTVESIPYASKSKNK